MNRRHWLKTAGLALAGVIVAAKFRLLRATPAATDAEEAPRVAPPSRRTYADEDYIHGFETGVGC